MTKGFIILAAFFLSSNMVFFGFMHHSMQQYGADQVVQILWWHFRFSEITFYSNLLSAFSTTLGVFAAVATLIIGANDKRKQNAHDMVAEWSEFLSTEHYIEISNLDISGLAPDEAFAKINQKLITRISVKRLLVMLEDWAIGIHTGYVDKDIILRSISTVFVAYHDRFKGYIEYIRKNDGNLRLYEELTLAAATFEKSAEKHKVKQPRPDRKVAKSP
jgi:hypothetical protein